MLQFRFLQSSLHLKAFGDREWTLVSTLDVEVLALRTVGAFLAVGTQRIVRLAVVAIVATDDRHEQRLKTRQSSVGRRLNGRDAYLSF